MATYEKWEKLFASPHTYKDDVRIYFGQDKTAYMSGDGTTITTVGATSFTGNMAITGDVTLVGDVTTTGETMSMTVTAPTGAVNAISGAINATATWASGEINAVYGKTTITLDSDGSTYSAAGGHFELEMVGNATSGLGMLAACMVKFTSNLEEPNAILYLESYPTGSCDMSETPFITFCDYKSGSGVKSNTLLRIGDPVMGQPISTGSGEISHEGTLRCSIYDDTSSRAIYLPTSSVQGTYTTAYLIQSSLATDATSSADGAVIIAGGVGIAAKLFVGTNLDVTGTSALDGNVTLSANLYLPSSGVIDFNTGEITMTHSSIGTGGKILVATTWSTDTTVGRPFEVLLTLSTDTRLGDYANAFKAMVDCGEGTVNGAGSVGLLSAGNFEMGMPNKPCWGAYYCLEMEYTDEGNTSFGLPGTGSSAGFMFLGASGTVSDFDSDGVLMSINGLTANADKLLSLTSQTLRVDLDQGTIRYLVLSQLQDGLGFGVASPQVLTFDGTKQLGLYTTCGSTDTGTNYEPQYIYNIMTGAGQVGCRFRINMETNVELGAWANAFKASVDMKTNGATTGLLAAGCFELVMPASYTGQQGTMAAIELEFNCPESWTGAQPLTYIYCGSGGSTKTNFDTHGYLFYIKGQTPGQGKFEYNGTLRCRITDTQMYLPLSSAEGSYTTAYPVVLSYSTATALDINSSMATAHNVVDIEVTDGSSLDAGRGRALYAKYTIGGTKTAAFAVRTVAIDTFISAACPGITGLDMYMGDINDLTVTNLIGVSLYMEDIGSAIANRMGVDLGMITTNTATSRDCFMRFKGHGGTSSAKAIFNIEGTNNKMAVQFMILHSLGNAEMLDTTTDLTSSHSITGALRVSEEAVVGGGTTRQYYIPLYEAD